MIRALLWKEYREQRLPAAILVGLGVLILTAVLPVFDSDQRNQEMRIALAMIFAGACGMVTGAILLANEEENGTQTLLDHLPKSRRQIWFAKFAFGVPITMMQSVLLAAACFVTLANDLAAAWPIILPVGCLFCGIFGLFCGMLGSSFGRSVLSAIGYAVLFVGAWNFIGALFGGVLQFVAESIDRDLAREFEPGWFIIAYGLLWPAPAVISLLVYSRHDVSRRLSARFRPLADKVGRIRGAWGARSLLWLSARRSRVGLVLFSVVALIAGQILLAEPLLLWPVMTLTIGLIQGVCALTDEQTCGSFRFLADQRLPVGRIWAVKTAWRFFMAIFFCALMLVSAAFFLLFAKSLFTGENQNDFGRLLEGRFGFEGLLLLITGPGVFATLWVVYGFCIGQIAGMLFRKILVALFLGMGASLIAVSVWVPSLVSGGMPVWQLFAIPLGLLVLARLLVWAWASDRLASRRSISLIAAACVAGILWIAGSFAWRAYEAPPAAPPIGVNVYLASLPPIESDPARPILQRARVDAEKYVRNYSGDSSVEENIDQSMDGVLIVGWRAKNEKLQKHIDRNLRGEWPALIREAARHPVGSLTDPRLISPTESQFQAYQLAKRAIILALQALRQQSEGKHQDSLDLLLDLLTVSRHLQNRALFRDAQSGMQMEVTACRALAQWMQHPQVSLDLLQRALQAVLVHEQLRPPTRENVYSEYVLAHLRMDNPRQTFMTQNGHRDRNDMDEVRWRDWVLTSAMLTPWEKTRRERVLNSLFNLMLDAQEMTYPNLVRRAKESPNVIERDDSYYTIQRLPPCPHPSRDADRAASLSLAKRDLILRIAIPYISGLETMRFAAITFVRATQIQLALMLYQRRHG